MIFLKSYSPLKVLCLWKCRGRWTEELKHYGRLWWQKVFPKSETLGGRKPPSQILPMPTIDGSAIFTNILTVYISYEFFPES